MFDKLSQAQQKIEEVKNRLDNIQVVGEAAGGNIKVSATANKNIKDIHLDAEFLKQADKEELEELLVVAVNKALEEAEKVSKAEMESTAKGMLGGLGGLFGG